MDPPYVDVSKDAISLKASLRDLLLILRIMDQVVIGQ